MKFTSRTFFFLCSGIALILLSRFVFERIYLYQEFWWLDIPMHIVAGFLVYGLVDSCIVHKKKDDILLVLAIFLFIATFWEMYEYFGRGVVERDWYGLLDTIKDYIDGVLGVYLGHSIIRKRKLV